MILLFPVLLLITSVLSLPAFWLSKRKGSESWWLLFLSGPALAVWMGLTFFGYGAQSLANIIEVFWLAAAGVLICYLKVLMVDRFFQSQRKTTFGLILLLVIGAVLLRTFMPVLPE
jgi:hypothetical protein